MLTDWKTEGFFSASLQNIPSLEYNALVKKMVLIQFFISVKEHEAKIDSVREGF